MAIALVILVAFLLFLPWQSIGPAILATAKRLTPTMPKFSNPLAAEVTLPIWKVFVLIGLFWLVSSGGVTLPGWKLPDWSWFSFSPSATEFIVLHEGTKDDDAFSKVTKTLQDQESTVGKAIIEAGWKVFVLDDDAEDKDNQPLPLLKSLGVHGSITDSHRELLSIASGKLLKRENLPADATGEAVFSMMQVRGKRK